MPFDLSPLWISLKTAGLATVITFFLGIAAACWMLDYHGKWKSLIEGIFISPLILPPTVVGFLLLLLLGRNGPAGQLLSSLNISIIFTWYAAVVAATVVSFPLMYRTVLAAFEQIDLNLQRAARTLGASETTVFWQITLPLALPGILAGTVLAFARALGEFGATLMLAGNIPGQTQTIPMAIYFAVEGGAMSEAWVWSLTILGISLSGITAANYWQHTRGFRGKGTVSGTGEDPSFHIQHLSNVLLIQSSKFKVQNSSSSHLSVNIQKKLADFFLDVCFTADVQPLGLLGASGAGKSLILRCIAGIETPDSGQIVLNGRVLFDSQRQINLPSRDRHVGFLFQNYALFPHLTVAQNIAFGLSKRDKYTSQTVQQQVEAQLAAVQLQGLANRYPHQLSGGQQQRVALARSLASQPEVLLLDEPFSALDTHLRSQIEQQMIASLKTYAGVTLFVTHNLEEAYRVCQNLLVLERGKAIATGAKQAIFEQPQTLSVAQLTGCKNFSRAIAKTAHQIEALDWQCTLNITAFLPPHLQQVGIRAHQLAFVEQSTQSYLDSNHTSVENTFIENTFPCWLVTTSETPHRMTLYLKLHTPPNHSNDHHLQAEVFKEKWAILKDQPLPWHVRLDSLRLMLLED